MKKWTILIGRLIGPGIVGLIDLNEYNKKQPNMNKLANEINSNKRNDPDPDNSKSFKMKQKKLSLFKVVSSYCIKLFNNIFNPLKGIPDLDFNDLYDSDML